VRGWRLTLALSCLAAPLLAQQPPPESSALPPDRPYGTEPGPVPPEQSAPPPALPEAGARPDPEARLDELEKDKPEEMPRTPPVHQALAEDPADLQSCLATLDEMGVSYERSAARTDPEDSDCGIVNPLTVTEILPGVSLSPAAELRCETARAMATWVRDIVQPAAGRLDERGALAGLEQGSGYICRRRNNAPEGKLSEHSFGNAIDVMAFRFAEGEPIRVEPREREGTLAEAFQRTARAGACLYFTTVLGPGTDAAHADHLHLDVKQRRGGFRLCQ